MGRLPRDAAAHGDRDALDEAASEVADRVAAVRTFEDDGVLTMNRGLVIEAVEGRGNQRDQLPGAGVELRQKAAPAAR